MQRMPILAQELTACLPACLPACLHVFLPALVPVLGSCARTALLFAVCGVREWGR